MNVEKLKRDLGSKWDDLSDDVKKELESRKVSFEENVKSGYKWKLFLYLGITLVIGFVLGAIIL